MTLWNRTLREKLNVSQQNLLRTTVHDITVSTNHWDRKVFWATRIRYTFSHPIARRKFWDYLPGSRYQWPHSLRHSSAAARPLGLWVRILPRPWMLICCECCVLSGRSFCDELLTRPEESYRLWCVVVCDLETSWMMRTWPRLDRSAIRCSRLTSYLV